MYKELELDFEIPDDLQDIITEYLDYLNKGETDIIDYYRTEIQLILNWCYRESLLTDEQIKLIRDYYQRNGILRQETTG